MPSGFGVHIQHQIKSKGFSDRVGKQPRTQRSRSAVHHMAKGGSYSHLLNKAVLFWRKSCIILHFNSVTHAHGEESGGFSVEDPFSWGSHYELHGDPSDAMGWIRGPGLYTCACICIHTPERAHTHTHRNAQAHSHKHTRTHAWTYSTCKHTHIHKHSHTHMHTHTNTQGICMYLYACLPRPLRIHQKYI